MWGDAIGKPIERPPFTQLPPGGVAQPQNLKYTVEEIGQVVQAFSPGRTSGSLSITRLSFAGMASRCSQPRFLAHSRD